MLNDAEAFRAQELLMQRATDGLSLEELHELDALGMADDDSYDVAAAAISLATVPVEAMPAHVTGTLLAAAGLEVDDGGRTTQMTAVPMTLAGVVPPRPISTIPPQLGRAPDAGDPRAVVLPPTTTVVADAAAAAGSVLVAPVAPVIPLARRRRTATYAMIAAAASIAIGVGAVVWSTQRPPVEKIVRVEVPVSPPAVPAPTAAEARAALLASSPDVTTLAWTATDDANGRGTTGDVVWSASAQRGFMRFVGLTPNDVQQLQYQLWIFDKDRDQAFPVDGGVFDVSSTGEVVIEITARLRVTEPVLFAVTIEQPGGVVVSKRERIVVTAAPSTG